MGLGGYGGAHNLENLSMALDLSPDVVVFALYFGNDFYDDFRFALDNDRLSDVVPKQRVDDVVALERQNPLADEVDFLFRLTGSDGEGERGRPTAAGSAWRWLPEHIRLFGLLRAMKARVVGGRKIALLDRDFERATSSLTDRQLSFVSVYDGDWKTILTAPYRLRVMDDSDERIRSGIEVTKQAIRHMRNRVVEAGAEYLAVLLPTKEYVFLPRVDSPASHAMLDSLAETEERLHGEFRAFLAAEGIRYVDPAPALRSSFEQPYPANGE
jgi:hypothetical protein